MMLRWDIYFSWTAILKEACEIPNVIWYKLQTEIAIIYLY